MSPAPLPISFLPMLEEMAFEAGAILLRHFRKLEGYDKKGAIDLQTIADRESELFLIKEISTRFPDHSILAEENGNVINPGGRYQWIVDPLDGTTNYAHGLRLFGVSIGVVRDGIPVAGAVFAPAMDEMYLAERGSGTTRNGNKIKVSDRGELIDALLVTGFPYNRRENMEALSGMHRAALEESRGVLRLGAASLDFAAVAAGHLDAFYEFGLKPWDVAAGALLVEEAGGRVTSLAPGEPLDLFKGHSLASNGLVHEAVQRCLLRGGLAKLPGVISG